MGANPGQKLGQLSTYCGSDNASGVCQVKGVEVTGRELSPSSTRRAIVARCRDVRSTVARPQCRQLSKCRYRRRKAPKKTRSLSQHGFGIVAEMDVRSEPGLNDPFEEGIDDALSSLPADLRAAMSNVEIVVEDEPPAGRPLLGLYHGVPLPRRSSTYSGVLPDKISIFRGPITRLAAGDADRLRREVRHVVLHEIAHHFGISDERLIELDRY